MISRAGTLWTAWGRRIDWPLMVTTVVLLLIGFVAVLSAVSATGNPMLFVIKQLVAAGLGLVALFVLSSLNYQLYRSYPGVVYGLSVLLLMAVLVFGRTIKGAQSWFVFGPVSFEPLEVARVGYVLVLAAFLDRSERDINSLKIFAGTAALAGIHMGLILMQPDLGGILAYIPVSLAMLYFAGVRPIYLLALIFFGAVAVGIPMLSTYFTVQPQLLAQHPLLRFLVDSAHGGRPMIELLFLTTAAIFALWWFLLKLRFRLPWQTPTFLSVIVALGVYAAYLAQLNIKDYQRKRLVAFLSPGFDPLGAGYNILQSEIALGSGRLFGKGLFSGSQTQLGFLPERHTDFIFSVIGEEMGFLWTSVVLGALGLLVWRAFFIASQAQDRFGALLAVGLGSLLGFQAVMNIGTVIGLLPVSGVALPLVSYGGSHVVTALVAIGLLQSVNFRRYMY